MTHPQTCPACGHSILAHRKGVCQVMVHGIKGKVLCCTCKAIQPPNSQPEQGRLSYDSH